MSPLREQSLSAAYWADMTDARRLVDELILDGWPLARIVVRARNLYRDIHRRELHRQRHAAVAD